MIARSMFLLALAAAATVLPSCGDQPPRMMQPNAPRRAPADPRYRPAAGISELRAVAAKVARASGREIRWRVQPGSDPGPLVRVRGSAADCTIHVHPVAARTVPPNTWAFLFGHEFAHLTGTAGRGPAAELQADIAGARYAMAAGYRIEAFLGWVLNEPDNRSVSHGSLHGRVSAIARHFNIPQRVIREEARRAARRL